MADIVEFLTDPTGEQIPFAEVVWTSSDPTGVSVPDWATTALRRAEREKVLEHLYRVFYMDLHLCGCGDPDSALQLIHDLLRLAPFYEDQRWKQVRELIGSDGAEHIVLSVLSEADLIEHGGSIGGSWATDKGRWLLWAIDKVGGIEGLDTLLDEVGVPHNGDECADACWKVPAEIVALAEGYGYQEGL